MILDADQLLAADYIEICLQNVDSNTAIVAGTDGEKLIQPKGAHRIYAKWFVDAHPFRAIQGYDTDIFYTAIENGYKVKIIPEAIATEQRPQRKSCIRDFHFGFYSYKLGYSFPFILARSVKNILLYRRLKAILMVYGFLFSFLKNRRRYYISRQISLQQKMRIKQIIMKRLAKM